MSDDLRRWEDVQVGDAFGPVVDHIDYRRIIMSPATTLDYFPGHFDPDYARSVGHPTIFANTMHLMGFVDRVAIEPFGPATELRARAIRLRQPVYAGDTINAATVVVDKSLDPPRGADDRSAGAVGLLQLEIAVANQRDDLCCEALVRLAVPL